MRRTGGHSARGLWLDAIDRAPAGIALQQFQMRRLWLATPHGDTFAASNGTLAEPRSLSTKLRHHGDAAPVQPIVMLRQCFGRHPGYPVANIAGVNDRLPAPVPDAQT